MNKKKLSFIIVALLFVACKKDPVNIGLGKFISTPSNDLLIENIVSTVNKEHPEANFEILDAEGNQNKLDEIVQQFSQNENLHLRVAIDSPMAKKLSEQASPPLIYGAVTNPENAGLFSSKSSITGYSDAVSSEAAIENILSIMPELKHVGQIRSVNEPNSEYINFVINYRAPQRGIPSISGNVIHNVSQISDAINSMIGGPVEALYLANSSYLAQNLSAIVELAGDIPVFSSDPVSSQGTGVVFAYGADYVKIGQAIGELIIQFIEAKSITERDALFIEQVRRLEDAVQMYADQEAASKFGLSIPAEIMEQVQ